ncbi:unnamed protein product, partial [Nesidiocoris tenuis]
MNYETFRLLHAPYKFTNVDKRWRPFTRITALSYIRGISNSLIKLQYLHRLIKLISNRRSLVTSAHSIVSSQ